jgi:hypothetical protein
MTRRIRGLEKKEDRRRREKFEEINTEDIKKKLGKGVYSEDVNLKNKRRRKAKRGEEIRRKGTAEIGREGNCTEM